jgi:hypothetical protein
MSVEELRLSWFIAHLVGLAGGPIVVEDSKDPGLSYLCDILSRDF